MRNRLKNSFRVAVFFMVLLLAETNLLSAQEAEDAISIFPLPQELNAVSQKEFEYHYFGGQEISLPLIIQDKGNDMVDLKVEANQVGFSMGVPHLLEPKIISHLKDKVHFSCNREVFIELPDVKREIVFELIFKAKVESEENWREAGRAKIHIYPMDILKPLQAWSERIQLRLDDREGNLANFFNRNKITYVDSKAAIPLKEDQKIVTVIVRDISKEVLQSREDYPNETVIIFREKKEGLPKIMVRPFQKGQLIDVSMSLIQDLANRPLQQTMLLDILRLSNTLHEEE